GRHRHPARRRALVQLRRERHELPRRPRRRRSRTAGRLRESHGDQAMNQVLQDLLEHQFWADTVSWAALGALAAARDDRAIHARFQHLHQVRRGFFWGVGGGKTQFTRPKPEDLAGFDVLREYARGSHDEMRGGIAALTAGRLAEPIRIPWFKDPPLTIT